LQRTVLAAVACGEIGLAYGFPNRQSEAVIRHAGYRTLGDLDRWVKPLSCRVAFDRWAWPRPLSRSLAAVLDPILRCANGVRNLLRGCALPWERIVGRKRFLTPFAVQQVDTFDFRFDRLWESAARQWPILGERTSDYLSWRFSQCPDLKYRAMCLSDSSGELLGYVIHGRRGETVYAADFLVADMRHLEPLWAEFLRLVERERAQMVVVLYLGRPEVGQTLARFGFWKRPSGRKAMLYAGGKAEKSDTPPSARTDLALRQSCSDVWHSRPRLCELPYTAEGGCATTDHRFVHQAMPDGALAPLSDAANWHLTGADIDTDG
jgi:hypothetical protein